MGKPSNHPMSIVLDCCYICAARFVGAGGTEQREDHHVIPVAYGGVDGPTVTLCDTHHSKVHGIAVALKASKPYKQLLDGEPRAYQVKLMWLAKKVSTAEQLTRNDPNKAAQVTLTLNANHKQMIDSLRPIYPNAKSRESILLIALGLLHSKHFLS